MNAEGFIPIVSIDEVASAPTVAYEVALDIEKVGGGECEQGVTGSEGGRTAIVWEAGGGEGNGRGQANEEGQDEEGFHDKTSNKNFRWWEGVLQLSFGGKGLPESLLFKELFKAFGALHGVVLE